MSCLLHLERYTAADWTRRVVAHLGPSHWLMLQAAEKLRDLAARLAAACPSIISIVARTGERRVVWAVRMLRWAQEPGSGQHCFQEGRKCTPMGLPDVHQRRRMRFLRTGVRSEGFVALLLAGWRHSSLHGEACRQLHMRSPIIWALGHHIKTDGSRWPGPPGTLRASVDHHGGARPVGGSRLGGRSRPAQLLRPLGANHLTWVHTAPAPPHHLSPCLPCICQELCMPACCHP